MIKLRMEIREYFEETTSREQPKATNGSSTVSEKIPGAPGGGPRLALKAI